MAVLISFFIQYLLAPLIAVVCIFIINKYSKGRAMLNNLKLLIFVFAWVILLVIPSLIGAIKFEFVWVGLYLSIIVYLFLGAMMNLFKRTKMFKSIGMNDVNVLYALSILIIVCLSAWIYFFVFNVVSDLNYSAWTSTLCLSLIHI